MLFEKLNALALQTPLVLTVTADAASGKLTLIVAPKADKDTPEAALRQPLALTATPAEFDDGFFDALDRYTEARRSLMEQAEATAEVLAAAKQAQVDKAAKASARTGKQAVAKPARVEEEEGNDDGGAIDSTGSAAALPTTGAASGTGESLFE